MTTKMDIAAFFPGEKVATEDLVRKVLRLDPSALAKLSPTEDPPSGKVMAGLNVFMRETIDRAIGRNRVEDGLEFQPLQDEALALELGWPDLRTIHLSTLLSWALLLEARIYHGLPYAPLVTTTARKANLRSLAAKRAATIRHPCRRSRR